MSSETRCERPAATRKKRSVTEYNDMNIYIGSCINTNLIQVAVFGAAWYPRGGARGHFGPKCDHAGRSRLSCATAQC